MAAKSSRKTAVSKEAVVGRTRRTPKSEAVDKSTGGEPIVRARVAPVKGADEAAPSSAEGESEKPRGRPGRKKSRRQQHGSAWHWKQTDCWYYTLPGTKRRIPLFDDEGDRIKGKDNRELARRAMARVQLADEGAPAAPVAAEERLVAWVCSEYLQYCERGASNGSLSRGHWEGAKWLLNDLCRFCGALPVVQLKKNQIKAWMEGHTGWKSPATHRTATATLLAAFNYAENNFDVPNPLKGLKRAAARPRLQSLSPEEEAAVLGATDEPFRDFLFAAIHTGLRPYCELARMTADDVEELPRGMMWRVYSSKTKKTRKIPVRPEVAELTRKLMVSAPRGSRRTLFRNTYDTPWSKVAGVHRFIAIRKRLGWNDDPVRKKYSSYTSRHTFAHRMLSGFWNNGVGCSIETLAELIGDTPKVAFDHYGKEWGQHYQDPLWNAIGIGKV